MIRAAESIAAYAAVFCFIIFPVLVIHCFYDDRITVSRKKTGLFALIPMIIKIIDLFPATETPLSLLLITAVPIAAVTGGKMRFYHRFINWSRYVLICFFSLMGMYSVTEATSKMIGYNFHISSDGINTFIPAVTVVLGTASLLMYIVYIKKNKSIMFRKQERVLVWIYCLFLCLLLFMDNNNDGAFDHLGQTKDIHDLAFLFFVLFIIILVPVFLVKNCQSSYYSRLSEHQQYFLEAELNASRQYKAAQEETRAFRHDVQNNLTAISVLMEQEKYKEAKQYLDDMRTEVSSFSPKIITGDEMLDSLISAKLAKIHDNGIKLTINGVIDGGLGWKPMDICTVFANALDNAIEASSQTAEDEQRYITMNIKKTPHQLLISLENSCSGDADCKALMNDELHFTSKSDKALHGYGIRNIRKIIEKNDGMMKVKCENKRFSLDMILLRTPKSITG